MAIVEQALDEFSLFNKNDVDAGQGLLDGPRFPFVADGNRFKSLVARNVNSPHDVFPAVHSLFRIFVVKTHF